MENKELAISLGKQTREQLFDFIQNLESVDTPNASGGRLVIEAPDILESENVSQFFSALFGFNTNPSLSVVKLIKE